MLNLEEYRNIEQKFLFYIEFIILLISFSGNREMDFRFGYKSIDYLIYTVVLYREF